ncbi:embigin [Syngnathoides biaculeatus]|uniref:embigin n=1 Tax=Syngnathoides biaculeatus TaxID=300417 RepID=UPI002ADE8B1F|nr:embigin [Syngnathoides biaculeatus]
MFPLLREKTRNNRITVIVMRASWMLLLLACCGNGNTKTVGQSAHPVESDALLPADARSVVLKGKSHTDKVDVASPMNLTLGCTWTGNGKKLLNVTGYWLKDGRPVDNSHVTLQFENQQVQLKRMFVIKNEENLGRYSCMFGNEAKADFILAVPHIGDVRDKPVVSYVGDSVVLVCKMDDNKPNPKTWLWFRANGTDKEEIATVAEPQKYQVQNAGKVTKLHVHNLTQDDSGLFYCGAMFTIGMAVSHLELKVITIYEPLKPFVAIILEVLVLVAAILLFERSQSKKGQVQEGEEVAKAEPPATNAEPPAINVEPPTSTSSATPPGESQGLEETLSARQRKS